MPAKSNAEWELWGEKDPLFGVASWSGRGVDDEHPWTADDFYSLGESDWADFREQWASYGLTTGGTCVEIGSGAARLTRAMVTDFGHVHGVDVSPGMIAAAKPAVVGLPVTFHLSDGLTIPLDSGSVDAAFSTHVFQHLESPEDAAANWREIARVLKPGGTFLVHLPVHQWPGGFEGLQFTYRARRRLGDLRARRDRWLMRKGVRAPIMRGQSYAWNELEPLLQDLGFVDLELRFFRVKVGAGQHSIVLGRRT